MISLKLSQENNLQRIKPYELHNSASEEQYRMESKHTSDFQFEDVFNWEQSPIHKKLQAWESYIL